MTAEEFTQVRARIARAWGLMRLSKADLGRALGHGHERDPGQMIGLYETGRRNVPPTVAVTIKLYLAGQMPPDEIKATLTAFRRGPSHASPSTGGSEPSRRSLPVPG